MQHESDRFNWQGAQIPLIAFDELTHFARSQFFYMLSRNRTACGVRPYVRATYNPVPPDDEIGGWIHEFVGWYLDANGEYPDPAKAGIVRWFVNVNDKLRWFSDRETAVAEFPDIPPKSFTYIPSFVTDNKILMNVDPGYLANLYGLGHVDQERLLRGNHKIKPEAGKVINRDWFPIADSVPGDYDAIVRFWDFAATEKKRKMGAATASVKMGVDGGRFYVLDMTEEWIGPADIDGHVVAIGNQDGRQIAIRWEEEGGSSGKRVTFSMVQQLAGHDAAGVRPSGDKLARLQPFAAQARVGNVVLLRAHWNERFLTAMHATPDGLWDVRDATSGAFSELTGPAGGGVVTDDEVVEISPY
jgi:predicted phage terminase large subunit-like protein